MRVVFEAEHIVGLFTVAAVREFTLNVPAEDVEDRQLAVVATHS